MQYFLSKSQYILSQEKRKDDLFKIRYDFYCDLRKFITKECDHVSVATKSYGTTESHRLRVVDEYTKYLETFWLFPAECLFDEELAGYLRKNLEYDNIVKYEISMRNGDFDAQFKKYLQLK